MSVLAEVLLALAALMLVSTAVVVVTARVVYTRVRRSRVVGASLLRARATLTFGRQHEVLRLRVRLSDTLASGREALNLADRTGRPRGDLHRLFERIRGEAAAVDAQLILLSSERDARALADALPTAGVRVEQIHTLVRRLRTAVSTGLIGATDDALTGLTADVDREVAALDAGVRELHALNADSPLPGRSAP
ncbi:hypothetical protein [Cryobacterium sp. SO1]|uniref:hypothetical protein n=1 Tax=Cryobacterium sp. SO1 TaxID=1897061 RepID=UPI001023BBAF|nr:hypothetical protein [Cryobacterium sp. SO1]RZI36252.1 hypothetical protein BJQ95_01382 [Cryobacterium sp. SO1]